MYITLPFLYGDGVQLILDAIDLLLLQSPQCQQAVIERGAAVCADVEVLGVPLDGLHNLPRAGAAVHTGAPDVDSVLLKIREDALKRVLLVETDIGIAVAILYPDDEVAYDGHTGTVAGELLVGHLRVVFLRLYELMVEVHVV